jgi:hypothetical protein
MDGKIDTALPKLVRFICFVQRRPALDQFDAHVAHDKHIEDNAEKVIKNAAAKS